MRRQSRLALIRFELGAATLKIPLPEWGLGPWGLVENGSYIFLLDQNRIFKRWDVETGREVFQADLYRLESQEGKATEPHFVSISSDTTRMVMVNRLIIPPERGPRQNRTPERSAACVRAWDVKAGTLRVFEIPTRYHPNGVPFDSIGGLAISGNGERYVTVRGDHLVRVWDFNTGELLREHKPEARWERMLICNEDASRVISDSDGAIHVWDGTTGKSVKTIPCPKDSRVRSVAFLPNDRLRLVRQGEFKELWNGVFEARNRGLKAERRQGTRAFYGEPLTIWDVDLS